MEHQTLERLGSVAKVYGDHPRTALTRDQRLERWAELLEAQRGRYLSTLPGTEHRNWDSRNGMRSADSPISVAFQDPVLRGEGLTDDSYGEAKRFFGLSDWQLHDIVCYCHYGSCVSAETAARRVRAALPQPRSGPLAWMRQVVAL